MRSPDTYDWQAAPLRPLLATELRELVSGRALWIMLLLLCPLIGYSFFQAVSLYTEASTAALQSPVLANSLSPLDGILVPTLGSFYVAVTLLFPLVAIRALGQEKETGALRLLVQLPYRLFTIVSAKFAAVLAAWILASIPALSALFFWRMMGGHLAAAETAKPPLRPPGLRPAGRRARAVLGVDRGERGHSRDYRACRHNRVMGPGFHRRRQSRATVMDCTSVADPDTTPVRAGVALGWPCAGRRLRDLWLHRAGHRVVTAWGPTAQQAASLAAVGIDRGADAWSRGPGEADGRRHRGQAKLLSRR